MTIEERIQEVARLTGHVAFERDQLKRVIAAINAEGRATAKKGPPPEPDPHQQEMF